MACITFNMAEVGTARFAQLQDMLRISRAKTVGLLVLFWDETRRRELEQGHYDDVASCLPVPPHEASSMLDAFKACGYVHLDEDVGLFKVVDNDGFVQKRRKRQAMGSVCGKAGQVKKRASAQKTSRKPSMKDAPFALQPLQDAVVQKAPIVKTPEQMACQKTWQAYDMAYFKRIGTHPVRNAKSNSQIQQFVRRVGQEEAPHVIAFYVSHPDKRFTGDLYMLDMAVKKAESLRAQWATGRHVTSDDAHYFARASQFEMQQARIEAGEI